MTKGVKWAIGIAAALGGYLLLKNGALAATGGAADAPGVDIGDVKYDIYKFTWDNAKGSGAPYFTCQGAIVHGGNNGSYTWLYKYETPGGSLVSRSKMAGRSGV